MIYLLLLISSLFSIGIIECTSSGSTSATDLRQPVNFSGKLSTYYQDQAYIIENISVQGKYKDIIMYDAPSTHTKAIMNEDTKQQEIQLEHNPTTDFPKEKVNLEEINAIEVPSPDTVWVYQQKKNQPKHEYLEVKITYKDRAQKSFLLERKTEIYCYELTAESQKKIIPLSALKKLTVEGFSCRAESKPIAACPAEKK